MLGQVYRRLVGWVSTFEEWGWQSMVSRPVALTAQFTAKAREVECERADGLFRDPWAHLFSGEAGNRWLARQSTDAPGLALVLRTHYLDDLLAARRDKPAVAQVVLLAAGYDTRAFRLEWPAQTRLFEIDQPGVLAYKDRILQAAGAVPRCDRRVIGVDLEGEWTHGLLETGFQPEPPSIWVVEGLLMYLTPAGAAQVMTHISRLAAAGSWLGFDVLNEATLTSPLAQARIQWLAERGMPWQFGVDDPVAWVESFGWTATATTVEEAGRRYQRWPYPPASPAVQTADVPNTFFVTAQRR